MLIQLILFFLAGGAAGFLSGLLGVGGGVIVVPALMWVFTLTLIPEAQFMHVAEGTSLAIMIFTTLAAVVSHHRRGNIVWPFWVKLLPGSIVGTVLGAWLASLLDGRVLAIIFGTMLLLTGVKILFFSKHTGKGATKIPGHIMLLSMGFFVGVASGLLGIGGGVIAIPFFIYCNLAMHQASGTSAAMIFPLAIVGTISFMVTGHLTAAPIAYSTGYIYWPAFLGAVVGSLILVPLGTFLGAKINQKSLKNIFAVFLFLVAANLFFHALGM